MKTVTVRKAREDLGEVLRMVKKGEQVELLEGKKPIARIIPIPLPMSGPVPGEDRVVDWSDVRTRLDTIWKGKPAPGKPASQIIIDDRR